MDITRNSFLKAKDPKLRDSMLYDMLLDISNKMDAALSLEDRINICEKRISVVEGVGTLFIGVVSTLMGWFGFGR